MAKSTGRYLTHSFVCVLNAWNLQSYYATVTAIIIMPCFLGTNFNFARILLMRLKCAAHRYTASLSETDVELLMDPNHKMSALFALFFWLSWLPYIVHLFIRDSNDEPNPLEFWCGKCGAVSRLTILICFPRYRNYWSSCWSPFKSHLPCRTPAKSSTIAHSSNPQSNDYTLHI